MLKSLADIKPLADHDYFQGCGLICMVVVPGHPRCNLELILKYILNMRVFHFEDFKLFLFAFQHTCEKAELPFTSC